MKPEVESTQILQLVDTKINISRENETHLEQQINNHMKFPEAEEKNLFDDNVPYVGGDEAESAASLFEPSPTFHQDLNLANPSKLGIQYTFWERVYNLIKSKFQILIWLPQYQKSWLINDVITGLTVGAMIVSQAIAYSSIIGVSSPSFGFQCALISLLIFPLFGTSRHLTIGTASVAAIMTESVLQSFLKEDNYDDYVVTFSFMTGIYYAIMAFSGAGFVASFLAYPVLTGFQAGCAIAISATQIRPIFGLIGTVPTFYDNIESFKELADTRYGATIFFVVCLSILLAQKYFVKYYEQQYGYNFYVNILKNTPMTLILLIACTLINSINGGLIDPRIQVKTVTFTSPGSKYYIDFGLVAKYPSIFIVNGILFSVVTFTQHFVVGVTYGMKHEYDVLPFQELLSIALSNIIGAQFGILPSGGVISHAPLIEEKDAKSLLFNWVAAAIILIAILLLFFFPNLLYHLPKAVLASLVINAMIGLFPLQKLKEIWKIDSRDTVVMLITLLSTVFVGISEGVAIGFGISILLNVQRTSKPHCAILGRLPNTTEYHSIVSWPNAITTPGIIIFRFDGQLYFGNTAYFKQAIQTIVTRHHRFNKELYIFILDCLAINDIDSSGVVALDAVYKMLNQSNIILMLCGVKYPVLKQLRRTSFIQSIGSYHFFHGVHEAQLYIWRRICFIRGIPLKKHDDFILSRNTFLLNAEVVAKLNQPMSNDELGMLHSMSMDDSAVSTEIKRGFAVKNHKKLSNILHRSSNKINQENNNDAISSPTDITITTIKAENVYVPPINNPTTTTVATTTTTTNTANTTNTEM